MTEDLIAICAGVQGALMRTCTRVGDREVICVKHPRLKHLVERGYDEIRTVPTTGNSLVLCVLFTWLERLLDTPLSVGAVDQTAADTHNDSQHGPGPRGQLADVYISQIKRMHSNTQPSNFLTADLINMGCDNLTAIIQELCNEEERVTSNELTDVLAASLRFTFSMICFLRAAVSARMISHPEHYCSLLRSGVTNMSSLTRHCKQQVEPIGIEPEHGNIDAMLEALTAELRVGVHLQDFPTPGGSALFPLDAATRAKLGATVHLGYDQGSHRFFVLYRTPSQCSPHYSRMRAWASKRAAEGMGGKRKPFKAASAGYPPNKGSDPAANEFPTAASWPATEPTRMRQSRLAAQTFVPLKPRQLFNE